MSLGPECLFVCKSADKKMTNRSTLSELLCLFLLALLGRGAAYSYDIDLVAYVTFDPNGEYSQRYAGSYPKYAGVFDVSGPVSDGLSCPGRSDNETLVSIYDTVLFLELSGSCSDYEQAVLAHERGADGVVFYYVTDNGHAGPTSLQPPPEGADTLTSLTVVLISLKQEELDSLLEAMETFPDGGLTVQIKKHYQQSFKTSHTFYFVVFAFSILMILSCLWFVTSYVRRCRNNVRSRRRLMRNQRVTQQVISKLEVRTHKVAKGAKGSEEQPTCAICLDTFSNNDSIRVLPCKHEFHKKCVDPWLKLKRTCPICKQNIASKGGRPTVRLPRERGRTESETVPLETELEIQSESEESERGSHVLEEEQTMFLDYSTVVDGGVTEQGEERHSGEDTSSPVESSPYLGEVAVAIEMETVATVLT